MKLKRSTYIVVVEILGFCLLIYLLNSRTAFGQQTHKKGYPDMFVPSNTTIAFIEMDEKNAAGFATERNLAQRLMDHIPNIHAFELGRKDFRILVVLCGSISPPYQNLILTVAKKLREETNHRWQRWPVFKRGETEYIPKQTAIVAVHEGAVFDERSFKKMNVDIIGKPSASDFQPFYTIRFRTKQWASIEKTLQRLLADKHIKYAYIDFVTLSYDRTLLKSLR